ncbi:MAG: hypothetical protein R3C99_24765 [Pirellulaceae bacterium]
MRAFVAVLSSTALVALFSSSLAAQPPGCCDSAGVPQVPTVVIGEPITYDVAYRNLQIAELQSRLADGVDYPLRLRQLDTEIKLADAELQSLRRINANYSKFNRVSNDGGPLLLEREQFKLDLLRAELRLKNLRDERFLLNRHLSEQRRLHQLLVQRARQQVEASTPTQAKESVIIVGPANGRVANRPHMP